VHENCLPGWEDFGISPVEAQAAGKPVIAFARGGALETVKDGVSGIFFEHQDVDSVDDAIARCDGLDTSPEQIAVLASRFGVESFQRSLTQTISAGIASHPMPGAL
jgi:glycosyltransferase involved in cell wall biosynthesis